MMSAGRREKFQSRYRAASHFRITGTDHGGEVLEVSISLSSGFSFQVPGGSPAFSGLRTVSISLSSGFSFQGSAF